MLLFFTVSGVAVKHCQVLAESNVAKLMDLLCNFSDRWNEIGLELGLLNLN